MQIATFIDSRDATAQFTYGFGPDGSVFVAIDDGSGGYTYKMFTIRKVPILDIYSWPMTYGVVMQPVSPGSSLIFQTYDIWEDHLEQFHFLDGQPLLEKRADALKAIAIADADYLRPAPKWVSLYMADLFGL
ncbi:hypothetical protein POV27_09285 [Aureisphaera galaxeae]|uniref:hypothetical protein n=1 Tax=Aureisphaera galaxeae TaxID=1538023 RepID=UPI002350EC2F|nr:hypothetical protein [Aureisphaera galaxeae]MDC8004243.1 hypothetical protein [Aureisphaera galaxeae]